MDIPQWHVGHVVWKLMLAQEPEEMTRGELAEKSGRRPMTITHMLRTGRSDDDTVEDVARVFGLTAFDLKQEVQLSNQRAIVTPDAEPRRRASDRDPLDVEAEQYVRRLQRLTDAAQTAIFNTIRAFESALGHLNRRNEH
jgi:hypothetical protein